MCPLSAVPVSPGPHTRTHTQLFLLFPPASLYVRMLHYVALITKTQHVLPCCVPAWLPGCPTVAAATVAEVDHQAEWLNAAVIAATCNATVAFSPPLGQRVAQKLKHCGSNKNNIRFSFGLVAFGTGSCTGYNSPSHHPAGTLHGPE